MQPPSGFPQLRRYHSAGLLFPCISEECNIGDWLEHSNLAEQISGDDMASQTDDGSVDGTVSSVGESTWDMIDEGSVASENISYVPLRTPLSVSDELEHIHIPQPCPARDSDIASESTEDSDQEDRASDAAMSEPPHSPQATPVALYAQKADAPEYGLESSYAQELMGTIHLQDVSELDSRLGIRIVSAQAWNVDNSKARRALKNHQAGEDFIPIEGKVHMGLKDGGLEVRDTFKLLYCGPKEMKSAITQKIGSALAANPRRPLLSDGPASSRVTVVPISSFMDESSPEVVMIESGGFDMIIEECINAKHNDSGGVTLDIESGNTIEYRTARSNEGEKLEISAPTGVPDLGIIYFPEKSIPSERLSEEHTSQICLFTQQLFLECGIPYYVISDTDWLDNPRMPLIGSYRLVPHRSTDILINGILRTRMLPIDITTFLALDASQLHQNLVALKKSAANPHPKFLDRPAHLATELRLGVKWASKQIGNLTTAIKTIGLNTRVAVAVVFLTMISIPLLRLLYAGHPGMDSRVETNVMETTQIKEATFSKLGMVKKQLDIQMKSNPPSLAGFHTSETQKHPVLSQPARKKEPAAAHRKSDARSGSRDLLVRVIGDSNILIRSFKPTGGSKNLKFETRRNGKILPHQLQKIDEEYLVLEIPSMDAYGQIEIQIWTTTKPRYNQTFEIDLGLPWLKVNGWKEIAQNVAENAIRETQALHQGILDTLKRGSTTMDDMRRNERLLSAIRKLSTSMADLEQAIHSASNRTLRRSMQRALKAQRQLSRLAQRIQRTTLKQSGLVAKRQARLSAEIKELVNHMSKRLSEQQLRFEKIRGLVQRSAKSTRLRRAYEKKVRKAQKKLLHTWWKIWGNPA